MKPQDHIKILQENLLALKESKYWLERSFSICNTKFNLDNLLEEGYDAFESLTARFARTTDILTNKVFRSIVYLEEGTTYTWLDTLLYMEKQGVTTSTDDMRFIKELRNEIVHEYILPDIKAMFKEVLDNCSLLLCVVDNAESYAEKLLSKLQ